MPKRPTAPDIILPPETRRIAIAKARLIFVTLAESSAVAENRFESVVVRSERSVRYMEATFRAAQALRDLGTIDQAEAAFIFSQLYACGRDWYEKNDTMIQQQLASYADQVLNEETPGPDERKPGKAPHEKLFDRVGRRQRELESTFHAARGEFALSYMLLENPNQYQSLCIDGEFSLGIEDRFPPDPEVIREPDPKQVALLTERIIALAATETGRETLHAWDAFCEAEIGDDEASGVAAVQRVREMGLVSADEAVGLVDTVLGSVMSSAVEADRECARLQTAIDAVRKQYELDPYGHGPDGAEHFEWKLLDRQIERRANGVMAYWLRRYGEHRSANLLVEHPDEYKRLATEVSVGGWGG